MKNKGRAAAPARRFYLSLGIIAVLGVVALIYVLSRSSAPQVALTLDPGAPAGDAQPYVLGDTAAPVTIMEFADFQCPICAQYAVITEPDVRRRIVDQGLASYQYYDFPLPQHQNSVPASLAAACASDQGRFWEMQGQIYAAQNDWAFARNPKSHFEGYARAIGLDVSAWEACYDERRHLPRIQANAALAARMGVNSTPTFIIGGQSISGDPGYDRLRAMVDSAAARAARGTGTGGATR